ncbi:MAG TPA: hypothetical protein VI488_14430 [Candidatus Angelobacter sp.]
MSRNRIFMVVGFFVAMAACFAWAGTSGKAPSKDQSNAVTAFDKLKALAGQWEADSDKGKVTSSLELVSNGTALMEKINVPGDGEMVTVYYLDGHHLVLTHYCSAGNQPHMQAQAFDPASNVIRFDFAGATNLASAGDAHMHTAQITFLGADAFNADWTLYKDGKAAFTVPIQFHRVR